MRHRWNLFETYTVPSVLSQTEKRFTWLVLFDKDTDHTWLPLIEIGPYVPLFLSSDWLKELQDFIQPYSWIVTTRLDNDDVLHPEFMATVQRGVTKKRHFLNITNGFIQRGKKLYPENHTHNPFISFIEPGAAKTVYHVAHGRAMESVAPVRQVLGQRLWTQIIHERNYING